MADEVLAPGRGELEPALRALQRHVERHPGAFRDAIAALVAEGRRFAETPEGALWRKRLRRSPLLPGARRLLDLVSLSAVDEPQVLPSGYVDALLRAAASEEGDAIIERVFGRGRDAR